MIENSRQALVGDIGATNVRLAIADIDELTSDNLAFLRADMFASPIDAITGYLKTIPRCPSLVSLSVAGPVINGRVSMTNLPWEFSEADIREATGAKDVCLINDFEAEALALPHLTQFDLHQIGGATVDPVAPKVVVGAGTGLGVAGLIRANGEWVTIPGEGGHMSFAPQGAAEIKLLRQMGLEDGHLSCERLISGPGLLALYRALAERKKQDPGIASVPDLVHRALVEHEPVAREAVEQFVVWLGRFAGDLGLIYGAHGGVYVGGGIAPKLLDALTTGAFRSAFEDKGRLSGYMADIPVVVIKAADSGLRGAALAMSRALAA